MANGESNIEKAMHSATHEEVTEWRRRGGIKSRQVQGIRRAVDNKLRRMMETKDTQELVKGLLWGELTEDQREYVRGIVPRTIPDEGITPLVAMVFAVVDKTVRSGDASQVERLLRISGETPEIKLRLSGGIDGMPFDKIDLTQLSDDELRRLAEREQLDNEDVIDADYQEIPEIEEDDITWQD